MTVLRSTPDILLNRYHIGGILLGLGLDILSKHWVMYALPHPYVVTSFFHLHPMWNPGISFGWMPLQGLAPYIFSLGIGLFLFYMMKGRRFTSNTEAWGWSLLVAGGLGNALDRLMYQAVFDFIAVIFGDWTFPVFNFADTLITIGGVILFFHPWFSSK